MKILGLFLHLIAIILIQNIVQDLIVTQNVKEIKFEGVCGKLQSNKSFQRQQLTKYLRLTLVFI